MADVYARRVTVHEARRHFEAGGSVAVSERGHETSFPITPSTTTWDRGRITWDRLAEMVNEWRGRYPNQRYYVVDAPAEPAIVPARKTEGQLDGQTAIGPATVVIDDTTMLHPEVAPPKLAPRRELAGQVSVFDQLEG